jgi:hypothetical protein
MIAMDRIHCLSPHSVSRALVAAAFAVAVGGDPAAQGSSTDAPKPAEATLDALAWLEGCWLGSVNQREFREHWLPLRGGMLVGAGQMVMDDKTQDLAYFRIESRVNGVHYVLTQSGGKEAAFRLSNVVTDERASEFTFNRSTDEFPERIVYRRGAEGWLYASAEGRVNGEARKVIYPMRRVDCESGELIRK